MTTRWIPAEAVEALAKEWEECGARSPGWGGPSWADAAAALRALLASPEATTAWDCAPCRDWSTVYGCRLMLARPTAEGCSDFNPPAPALAPSIATRLGPNPYAPPAPTRDGTEERRLLDLYRAKRAADGMNGRAWDAGIHFPADEALREAGEVPESIATWDAREALRARVNALAAPPRAETGREER
jgi:hypothetical protein